MKKILLSIMILIVISLPVYASPDTMSPDDAGNTYDLITITNPANQKDSTADNPYIISGYGQEGTTITLYWHDSTANVYRKIYDTVNYYDENGFLQTSYQEATVTIGASGLFMKSVELAHGGNNLLVLAEYSGSYQAVKFSITKRDYNLIDYLKSLT